MCHQSQRADILSLDEEAVLVVLREIVASLRRREDSTDLESFAAAAVAAGARRLDVGQGSLPAMFSLGASRFTVRPACDPEGSFEVCFLLNPR